jgi:hypothetical protein
MTVLLHLTDRQTRILRDTVIQASEETDSHLRLALRLGTDHARIEELADLSVQLHELRIMLAEQTRA